MTDSTKVLLKLQRFGVVLREVGKILEGIGFTLSVIGVEESSKETEAEDTPSKK